MVLTTVASIVLFVVALACLGSFLYWLVLMEIDDPKGDLGLYRGRTALSYNLFFVIGTTAAFLQGPRFGVGFIVLALLVFVLAAVLVGVWRNRQLPKGPEWAPPWPLAITWGLIINMLPERRSKR